MILNYIKIEQPIGTIYSTSINASDLLKIVRFNRRSFSTQGVQREPEQKKINEIGVFCEDPDAVFPTPIIISIDNNVNLNIEELSPNTGIITIRDQIGQIADVLDGQHRLLGIEKSGKSEEFVLPVVIMFDLTVEEKAYIFSTINSNQKPVSKSLIYDLYDVSETRSPNKTAHEIARALNRMSSSPFYNRLKMLGKREKGQGIAVLSQGTFVKYLLRLITKDAISDAQKIKKGISLLPDDTLQFRTYFINDQDHVILKVMENCFTALRDVFYIEWENPQNNILWKTTGYGGVMGALGYLIEIGIEKKTLSKEYFTKVFDYFKKYIDSNNITLNSSSFPGGSEQNVKKITNLILESNNIIKDNSNSSLEHSNIPNKTTSDTFIEYHVSMDYFNKAIANNPNIPENYVNRGYFKMNMGDYRSAIDDFNQAINLNPDFAEAYNGRGNTLYLEGDKDRALWDFDKTLELKSDYVEVYGSRGKLKYDIGDYEGALKDFYKAIELNQDYAIAYPFLSNCYKKLNESKSNNSSKGKQPTSSLNNEIEDKSQTFTVANVSFKMKHVEEGTFMMGATSEQGLDAFRDEKPAHEVTLSSYFIGETEVTQALWDAVMNYNPSRFKGSNRPVESVSWSDCQEFIRNLNELTGKKFRLPTEAEWEFAARGGIKSKGFKCSGSNIQTEVAWYSDNSDDETHDVASKKANELGLYDMCGNVWEWCSDWYDKYSSSPQINPLGATSGQYHVRRGGSWNSMAGSCRVSRRHEDAPSYSSNGLGLRLALSE